MPGSPALCLPVGRQARGASQDMIEGFGARKTMGNEMGGVKPKLLPSLKSYASRSWSVNWPITVIMFFEFLIGLTDVYVAGRVSKEVQATYGFVIQLYFVFIVIANFRK